MAHGSRGMTWSFGACGISDLPGWPGLPLCRGLVGTEEPQAVTHRYSVSPGRADGGPPFLIPQLGPPGVPTFSRPQARPGCRVLKGIKRMAETSKGNFETASHAKAGHGADFSLQLKSAFAHLKSRFRVLTRIFFKYIQEFCFPAGICKDFPSFRDLPAQRAVGELPSIASPAPPPATYAGHPIGIRQSGAGGTLALASPSGTHHTPDLGHTWVWAECFAVTPWKVGGSLSTHWAWIRGRRRWGSCQGEAAGSAAGWGSAPGSASFCSCACPGTQSPLLHKQRPPFLRLSC